MTKTDSHPGARSGRSRSSSGQPKRGTGQAVGLLRFAPRLDEQSPLQLERPNMKRAIVGFFVAGLMLAGAAGCLNGATASDLLGGLEPTTQPADQSSGTLTDALSSDALGALQGSTSKRELLASVIDLLATNSNATGTDALMWDLAASGVRDGRNGVEKSVAEFVINQVTKAVVNGATSQPSQSAP